MILRPSLFRPLTALPTQCIRQLHHRIPMRPVPAPTPFIPDAETFLTVIGRKLNQHAAKIPSWEALFTLTSAQLRELGVEPARTRRYLLHWREKFRNGEYGPGGDLAHVRDGVGEVRVVEVPVPEPLQGHYARTATATKDAGTRKIVVSVPPGEAVPAGPLEQARPVRFMKVKGAHTVVGPHVEFVKGTNGAAATIKVKEGMWEERRGQKLDGGERRRAEVRAKKRAEKLKNMTS